MDSIILNNFVSPAVLTSNYDEIKQWLTSRFFIDQITVLLKQKYDLSTAVKIGAQKNPINRCLGIPGKFIQAMCLMPYSDTNVGLNGTNYSLKFGDMLITSWSIDDKFTCDNECIRVLLYSSYKADEPKAILSMGL